MRRSSVCPESRRCWQVSAHARQSNSPHRVDEACTWLLTAQSVRRCCNCSLDSADVSIAIKPESTLAAKEATWRCDRDARVLLKSRYFISNRRATTDPVAAAEERFAPQVRLPVHPHPQ